MWCRYCRKEFDENLNNNCDPPRCPDCNPDNEIILDMNKMESNTCSFCGDEELTIGGKCARCHNEENLKLLESLANIREYLIKYAENNNVDTLDYWYVDIIGNPYSIECFCKDLFSKIIK
jgi:hypothetical protein